mmetsp:Transcript_85966/g.248142  ORF Transcript_85966/g.248142 Transcript_85966/m.248142 type:complete len:286 (+) Transcript_85966:1314-2171(+)
MEFADIPELFLQGLEPLLGVGVDEEADIRWRRLEGLRPSHRMGVLPRRNRGCILVVCCLRQGLLCTLVRLRRRHILLASLQRCNLPQELGLCSNLLRRFGIQSLASCSLFLQLLDLLQLFLDRLNALIRFHWRQTRRRRLLGSKRGVRHLRPGGSLGLLLFQLWRRLRWGRRWRCRRRRFRSWCRRLAARGELRLQVSLLGSQRVLRSHLLSRSGVQVRGILLLEFLDLREFFPHSAELLFQIHAVTRHVVVEGLRSAKTLQQQTEPVLLARPVGGSPPPTRPPP